MYFWILMYFWNIKRDKAPIQDVIIYKTSQIVQICHDCTLVLYAIMKFKGQSHVTLDWNLEVLACDLVIDTRFQIGQENH